MVSRYAGGRVAQKLHSEDANDLKEATKWIRSVPGAEGYADALFEAYAVGQLVSGITVTMDDLEGQSTKPITVTQVRRTHRETSHTLTCAMLDAWISFFSVDV